MSRAVRRAAAADPSARPSAPAAVPGPSAATAPAPAAAPAPWSPRARAGAYALVLGLAALLAVWGSFLVPFRVGGTLVPVSWAVAAVGTLLLGRAGARLAGPTGALGPGLLWIGIALALASRRAEGDVVVPGTVVGLGFLLLSVAGGAIAYGAAVVRPRA